MKFLIFTSVYVCALLVRVASKPLLKYHDAVMTAPFFILRDESTIQQKVAMKPLNKNYVLTRYRETRKYLNVSSVKEQAQNMIAVERKNLSLDADCLHRLSPDDDSTRRHHVMGLHDTKHRPKRQSSSMHEVELVLFLDYPLYLFWLERNDDNSDLAKAEMVDYYANVINGVNKRYASVTQNGFSVNILTNAIIIADTPSLSPWTQNLNTSGVIQAGQALDDFSEYIESTRGQIHGIPFDHAALITGFDLASGASKSTAEPGCYSRRFSRAQFMLYPSTASVTGGGAGGGCTVTLTETRIAYVRAVCSLYTVSVTQELFEELTAVVMAHELGHSLGSEHDGVQNSCKGDDLFIMAATLGIPDSSRASNPWLFSSCSTTQFRSFLDLSRAACTKTRKGNALDLSPYLQPEFGQKYPADIQCEIYIGPGSKLCRSLYFAPRTLRYHSMCRLLYCLRPGTGDCIPISAHDGTSCGDHAWCQFGVCVSSSTAPARPINCPAGDDPDVFCSLNLCSDPFFNDQVCCGTCRESAEVSDHPHPTQSGFPHTPTQSLIIRPPKPTQSLIMRPPKPTQSLIMRPPKPTQSLIMRPPRPTQSKIMRPPKPTQSLIMRPPRPTQSKIMRPGPTQSKIMRPPRPTQSNIMRSPKPTQSKIMRPPGPTMSMILRSPGPTLSMVMGSARPTVSMIMRSPQPTLSIFGRPSMTYPGET